ncbi:alpha/beta hydrolase [Anaerophaga thermohalophila]|uniref:alpha/beta hydrolase n=1 Tax=Anaerophaga thermohalophila TaxID=177400 RepID=UPI0004929C4E|nr:alpha/beta hydrolase [Anaerophaga thermohalophila]
MKYLVVLLCLLALGGITQGKQTQYGVDIPEGFQDDIDVVYKVVEGWQGKLDVYYNKSSKEPTPLVINIHGGGWNHGEKESQRGFNNFFKNGFAVANVEYRLVDIAPAPAAVEDVRCALLYMIRHAEKYNIDTQRIVLMGASAGGHLALMAGLLNHNSLFDNDCDKVDIPFKIAGIINKYGVTDLTPVPKGDWNYSSVLKWLGTGKNSVEFAASVSPISYVDADSPPVFIVHGDADPIVPYSQSVILREKLENFGVVSKFITVEGGGHGKFSREDKLMINRSIISFLREIKVIE